jgi:hypothetical protein
VELAKLGNTASNQKVSQISSKGYRFIEMNGDAKFVSICNFDYRIVTMIMVSNSITIVNDAPMNILECPSFSEAKLGTKGYIISKISYKLNGNLQPTLGIVNLHAPFKTAKISEEFFSNILSRINTDSDLKLNPLHDNLIILGDYNSRSLITANKEYIKDVEPKICEYSLQNEPSSGYDKNYCDIKRDLESIQPSDSELSGLIPDNTKNTKYTNLVSTLVASNSFNAFKSKITDWLIKEYDIKFLPSYKRQTLKQFGKHTRKVEELISMSANMSKNTLKKIVSPGQFFLEKHGKKPIIKTKTLKYRLPGYADRITALGKYIHLLKQNMYTTIPVFGNDHIPVVATFRIMTTLTTSV